MSIGICKSPDSRYWRALYKAALSEIGKSKLLERIAEAEKAVVLRARELFQAADDNGEEKEALGARPRIAFKRRYSERGASCENSQSEFSFRTSERCSQKGFPRTALSLNTCF